MGSSTVIHHAGRSVRLAVPVLASVTFGTLLWREFSGLDMSALVAALAGFTWAQLALALLFTGLSLRAVGQYDALIHDLLDTGVGRARARRAGTRAIALAQTLGFGTLTGALVRWRLLGELSAGAAMRLSVLVSLSFLAAMGVILLLALPLSGLTGLHAGWALPLGLILSGGLFVLARVSFRRGWLAKPLTSARIARLLLAALLDTGFAAAALWILLPGGIPYSVLFGAYLVALSAGLLSNAPGGVGAFDLTLLALLPHTGEAETVAALLCFRVIYYALPACLALLTLIRPSAPSPLRPLLWSRSPKNPPESALSLQDADLLQGPGGARYLTLRAPGLLALKRASIPLRTLHARASQEGRIPALYQCDQRQALKARRAGWSVLRIADEALIDPRNWMLDRPERRGLRRKLRQFEKSGLSLRTDPYPQTLTETAGEWAASHGGEKGLSMGRFDPELLRQQKIFCACQGNTPVAFISLHRDGPRWTLDLMRHRDDLPNGTMQALIVAGITAARVDGATAFSLAALPCRDPSLPLARGYLSGSTGLRRFKSSFAPTWQPRYLAAPGPASLALAALSLTCAINLPRRAQHHLASNSFATDQRPCDSHPEYAQSAGASDAHQCPPSPA